MIKRFMKDMFIGKEKYQKAWERLFKISQAGMNIGSGGVPSDDGEEWFIRYLSQNKSNNKEVLFDVGANVGEYSKMLRKYFPKGEIHAFEPSGHTYKILTRNCKNDNILLNNFGLGEKDDYAVPYTNEKGSGLASLYKRDIEQYGLKLDQKESVKLERLDDYCTDNGIDHIFLLKIDVEGNEMSILNNSMNMINRKCIDYIQFEFGGANIDVRNYFRDFWKLLSPKYRFYRLLRDGLREIKGYDERLELFSCTNYVLMRKGLWQKKAGKRRA